MSGWPVQIDNGQRFETLGADTSDSKGATLTAGAGSKGSYVELSAATSFDACGMMFFVIDNSITSDRAAIDIAIGGSGSEQILVADLLNNPISSRAQNTCHVYLPLMIPTGTRIAARAQSPSGETLDVIAILVGAGMIHDAGAFRCTTFGVSGVDGTSVDAGITANTKGAWVELSAATAHDIHTILVYDLAPASTSIQIHTLLDIGVGAAASEQVIVPNMLNHCEDIVPQRIEYGPPFPCHIPAGSRLAVRTQCDNGGVAADTISRIAIYGFG